MVTNAQAHKQDTSNTQAYKQEISYAQAHKQETSNQTKLHRKMFGLNKSNIYIYNDKNIL